jgi:hypothetical protein
VGPCSHALRTGLRQMMPQAWRISPARTARKTNFLERADDSCVESDVGMYVNMRGITSPQHTSARHAKGTREHVHSTRINAHMSAM